ncbi:MAG TPA: DEAD/DEAH box helicase [Chthoniobacterales bacterium]
MTKEKGDEMSRQVAATPSALTKRLHPRLAKWFSENFAEFTHAQLLAVPAILDRKSILLTSPTGSGKTLAAFLGIFDRLVETGCRLAGTQRPVHLCLATAGARLRYRKEYPGPDHRHGARETVAHTFADRRYALE